MMNTLKINALDLSFNACVHTMCRLVWPQWFDVGPDAPDTYEKLLAEYAERGRITVWDGASDMTIFGDPQTNIMFRAWHDWCHIHGQYDFSMEGETAAAHLQCEQVHRLYGGETARHFTKIIMAEVVGQASYEKERGAFPVDQMAFINAYLQDHRAALTGTF